MKLRPIPLHPAQREVYIDQLLDVGSPHYNVGGYVKLNGKLDRSKFYEAVKSSPLVFDAYQMRFALDLENFESYLDNSFDSLSVDELDFSQHQASAEAALGWMQERFNAAFEIAEDKLLFEHFLLKISETEYWFYGKYHHLITDGYGFTIWLNYLALKYKSLISATDVDFNYPSYSDEAIKSAEYYNSAAYQLDADYWKGRIKEKPAKLLEKRYFENNINDKKSDSFVLNVTDSQIDLLLQLQLQTKVSLQQLTIAALIIYFGKTSLTADFAFGIPLHKRGTKRLREILGMFSGIIPFKGTYDRDQLLIDLIKEVYQLQRKDYGYQSYLLGDLSRNFESFGSDDYLLDIVINYQRLNFELDFGKEIQSTVVTLGSEYEVTPLQLIWRDYGTSKGLQLDIKYRNEYFKRAEIELLAERLFYILEQFPSQLNSTISSIQILPSAEQDKLLKDFNKTSVKPSTYQTLVQLFEQQVTRTPENVAVKFAGEELTYVQLNERVNHLARYLQTTGVTQEMLVPIFVERGIEMIVGILAILKTGAAYIPIDIDYPMERVKFIVEDAAAKIVVVSEKSRSKLAGLDQIQLVETFLDQKVATELATENLPITINPGHLAYIIYTSGSTGSPKGVMVEHGSVVNLVQHQVRHFGITEDEVILQFSNYTFDASVEQIFVAIGSGATLLLISKEVQSDQADLLKVILENKVTHFHATPSFLETFPSGDCGSLKRVIAGGETCSLNLAERWSNKVDFFNEYGPTETTVTITEYNYTANSSSINLPIGTPVSNSKVYLLNNNRELTPIGIAGEIYIGGVQVARGYLNLPELTAEKFIDDPFIEETGQRLYRTGDLGRWLTDGNLEYLGRIDDQVKIRGYRIEPGEIESVLLQSGLVRQAVVIAKADSLGARNLAGYIVPNEGYNKQSMIAELEKKLPAYMIPTIWVELESLPVTSTGKIDKKALQNLEVGDPSDEFIAPRNEVEATLASIWCELLGVKRVGIKDNFFQLGGHSLKAIQSISRIHKALNVKTDIGTILSNPTIEKLATALKKDGSSYFAGIPKVAAQDHYELSHSQKRFFILSQFRDGFTAYNGVGAFSLKGALDPTAFQKAFNFMIDRHESLRTIFIEVDGEQRQKIIHYSNFNFSIEIVDLRGSEAIDETISQRIEKETEHRFDLGVAPLLNCTLLQIDDREFLVLFNIHHIISDGWSKAIFIDEFLEVYKQIVTKEGAGLQPLQIQYKDYAAWHKSTFEKQGEYWKSQYKNGVPVLNFPTDFDRPKVLSYKGAVIEKNVEADLKGQLNDLATQQGITLNNLLFSLYAMLVAKYSRQQQIVIGSLTSGRSHSDLENLIGVFINFLPVMVTANEDDSLLQYLTKAGDNLIQAYNHQDYPFDLMVDELRGERDISRNPFFDTMINFHPNVSGTRLVFSDATAGQNLTLKPFRFNDKAAFQSVLDFKVDVEFGEENCVLNLSYNSNLFTNDRMAAFLDHYVQLLKEVVEQPNKILREYLKDEIEEIAQTVDETNVEAEKVFSVNVCASFVVEPIQEYIEYWSKELELNLEVVFAPYNQVFQQLLNPASLLNSNKGINVLFIRIEDWLRDKSKLSEKEQIEFVNKNYDELLEAIKTTRKITSNAYLVGVVPAQPQTLLGATVNHHITQLSTNLELTLQKQPSFKTINFADIARLYDVDEMFDTISDKQGHMPFTQEFYGALGTYITRKVRAFKDPAYKVIALDCDNTLWSGIVGEVGTLGVTIDKNLNYLQEFFIEKYKEGFLLVLCSKNNEEDVWEVFDKHPGMKLKREHIAAHKINWQPKAENIVLLAKELNLGLDSFIFLDDNEFEIEQMSTACPAVYSIQLPEENEDIPGFLDHIWAFDVFQLTAEDLKRNSMYLAEKERKSEQLKFGSITDFLQALNIEVITRPLQEKDLDRAVQLTLRTNQFNLNGIRKTRDEIVGNMIKSSYIQWIVEVKDRFGDYGIVGLLIGNKYQNELQVQTFLLSCRVLGRQVENVILDRLKEFCLAEGLNTIDALYQSTGKNKPFAEFLGQTGWVHDQQTNTFRHFIKYSDRELLYTNNEKQLS